MALGPARVHADEHLGPVARFGAAAAGLNLQERVGGVLRAAEHRAQFECIELRLDFAELRLNLGF